MDVVIYIVRRRDIPVCQPNRPCSRPHCMSA